MGCIGLHFFPHLFFEHGQFGVVHFSPKRCFFLDLNNIKHDNFAVVLGGNFLREHRPDTAAGPGKYNGLAGKVTMFDAFIQANRHGQNCRAFAPAGT